MTHYEIIFYWSEEDHAFLAEVPELPDCMADGPTRQDAKAHAIRQMGWRVYVTNQADLTLEQTVLAYREQYLTERGFR